MNKRYELHKKFNCGCWLIIGLGMIIATSSMIMGIGMLIGMDEVLVSGWMQIGFALFIVGLIIGVIGERERDGLTWLGNKR